jgi:hypothetical protein
MGLGPFRSWTEVEALAMGFENQTLLGEHDWTHRDHVATAAYYCITDPYCASDRMRAGIQALNRARGIETTQTSGYHETLTIAWTRIIAGHVRGLVDMDNVAKVNSVITSFEDRKTTLRYYTLDRIMSLEARYGWVEPDLGPLP